MCRWAEGRDEGGDDRGNEAGELHGEGDEGDEAGQLHGEAHLAQRSAESPDLSAQALPTLHPG